MKLISPYLHGWLDYITFMMLLIVPLTIKMNGFPEFLVIVFALFEFILAVITRYPLGATRQLPFPVHGMIDLVSGIALIATPFLFRFHQIQIERTFYYQTADVERMFFIVLGVIYLVVWALTDFRGDVSSAGTELPVT